MPKIPGAGTESTTTSMSRGEFSGTLVSDDCISPPSTPGPLPPIDVAVLAEGLPVSRSTATVWMSAPGIGVGEGVVPVDTGVGDGDGVGVGDGVGEGEGVGLV